MPRYRTTAAVLAAAMLAGCAVAPQRLDYSLIDPKGVDMAAYTLDYNECAALANQTDVAERAAAGAVVGAVFGAIVGGLLCGRSCAQSGAAWGGGYGLGAGTGGGVREQQVSLRACLAGRGYSIIR